MKTSAKLLIVAALILIVTMTAYDFALRAEYKTGAYKDMSRLYKTFSNKDFDMIEIRSAHRLHVEISRSDTFDVKVVKSEEIDNINIQQVGTKLIITYTKEQGMGFTSSIKISCPLLKQLSADAVVIVNGKPVVTPGMRDMGNYRSYNAITVSGFDQDSLILKIENASKVSMVKNTIGYLQTDIGTSPSSTSWLYMDGTNQVGSAGINIKNKSKLEIYDLTIGDFKINISDSVSVNLSGASVKLIR